MRMLCRLGSLLVLLAVSAVMAGEVDWRKDLLKAEGFETDPASLDTLRNRFAHSPDRLNEAVARLGDDDFAVREAAEREILLMGKKVLPLLRQLPASDDPEVQKRLEKIAGDLGSGGVWSRDELVRYAVTSLTGDGEGGKESRVFAEFFRVPKPSLKEGYGKFFFESEEGRTGLVADGRLRLPGNVGVDGDQRLVITARALTGKEEFPDEFRIETKLGAVEGGMSFHVGVSVGNIRALFHPEYNGGGFRFEEVAINQHRGINQDMGMNQDMGFTPAADQLHSMSIVVRRVAEQNVLLDVIVTSADGSKSFRRGGAIPEHVIGKLDRISLDRSGRRGGAAIFDDFVVDWGQ